MWLLLTPAEFSQRSKQAFPQTLQHCADLLGVGYHQECHSVQAIFSQLTAPQLPPYLRHLENTPIKSHTSVWQRYWLNSFLMHWVFLLHKEGIWLHLSARSCFIQLSNSGKIKGSYLNLAYTPITQIREPADYLAAYQQLKTYLTPLFNQLREYSRLNVSIFWHNAAGLIEYCLNQLKQQGNDVAWIYHQLFEQKKWFDYEWNTFYRPVEYIDFPKLPFQQPVRMRKVCCQAYHAEQFSYCATCPKLKTMPKGEFEAVVSQWRR